MPDPFQHVQRGDPFPTAVDTVNGWQRAARDAAGRRLGFNGGKSAYYGVSPNATVFVLNSTGIVFPAFSVVKLIDSYLDTATLPFGVLEQPLFTAAIPDDADNLIGVLLEPVAVNAVGIAAVLGVAVVMDVLVNDAQHLCVRPIPGRIDAVESCRIGPARILRSGTGSVGSSGSSGSGVPGARGVVILTQDLPWDALGSGSGSSGTGSAPRDPSIAEQVLARLCVVRQGGSGISGTGSSGQQGPIVDIKYLDDDGNCIEIPDCTVDFCDGNGSGTGSSGTSLNPGGASCTDIPATTPPATLYARITDVPTCLSGCAAMGSTFTMARSGSLGSYTWGSTTITCGANNNQIQLKQCDFIVPGPWKLSSSTTFGTCGDCGSGTANSCANGWLLSPLTWRFQVPACWFGVTCVASDYLTITITTVP